MIIRAELLRISGSLGYSIKMGGDRAYLCLPLTHASRKAMLEAMAVVIIRAQEFGGAYDQAEAALAALEAMAK